MGNNHDKFFSKEKRKLLVLGFQGSGKSTLVRTLNQGKYEENKTGLDIIDIKLKNITLCVFDMGGSDRQRIFWRQNYYGSQGVIFVIDQCADVSKPLCEFDKVIIDQDLNEVHLSSSETPLAIFINNLGYPNEQNMNAIQQHVDALQAKYPKKRLAVFQGSALQYDKIMMCVEWLGKEMKPI